MILAFQQKKFFVGDKFLIKFLQNNSGQPYEKIEKDTDRDYYMTAMEAKEYGLIDEVVERKSDMKSEFNFKDYY